MIEWTHGARGMLASWQIVHETISSIIIATIGDDDTSVLTGFAAYYQVGACVAGYARKHDQGCEKCLLVHVSLSRV